MMIPDAKIDEVRERVDIIALVQRHGVELKKSGRSYKGLCPFHQEKSPSFYVFPDGKRFKCFGCQAGGDAISFVQRLMGKTFVETVSDLAKELGVDIEAAVDPAMKEKAPAQGGDGLRGPALRGAAVGPGQGPPRPRVPARPRAHRRPDPRLRAGLRAAGVDRSGRRLREHGLLAFAEKRGPDRGRGRRPTATTTSSAAG